jgi:hypothetical protein
LSKRVAFWPHVFLAITTKALWREGCTKRRIALNYNLILRVSLRVPTPLWALAAGEHKGRKLRKIYAAWALLRVPALLKLRRLRGAGRSLEGGNVVQGISSFSLCILRAIGLRG